MSIELLEHSKEKWVISWNAAFFTVSLRFFSSKNEVHFRIPFEQWKSLVLQMTSQRYGYKRKPDDVFLGVGPGKCVYGPTSRKIAFKQTDPDGTVTSGTEVTECSPGERKTGIKDVVWIELSGVKIFLKRRSFLEFRDAVINSGEKLDKMLAKWRKIVEARAY